MFAEWSATLTLTKESSKELFRLLKEQDEAFINDVLDGKCGFTLESADGRRVELVPKADRKTEPQNEVKSCMTCKYNPWVSKACREYKGGVCDNYEPQTERSE